MESHGSGQTGGGTCRRTGNYKTSRLWGRREHLDENTGDYLRPRPQNALKMHTGLKRSWQVHFTKRHNMQKNLLEMTRDSSETNLKWILLCIKRKRILCIRLNLEPTIWTHSCLKLVQLLSKIKFNVFFLILIKIYSPLYYKFKLNTKL